MAEDPPSAGAAPSSGAAIVEIDDVRWRRLVESHPAATAFHHPAWCDVLSGAYGYRPFALAVTGADGGFVAGMPLMEVRGLRGRRWLSLPFTDSCPPLASPPHDVALADALERERRAAGIAQVEVRAGLPSRSAHSAVRGLTHVLALRDDPQELLPTFSRSQVQRNIARASREGVVVRRGVARGDLLDTFYSLHLATRRRQGVPIQPRRFFEQLWERMLEPGLGFVLVAEVEERPAAAAVFLAWNRTLTYKFGASDRAFSAQRPNHLLFWEAIRWGCENGFAALDFGRTDLSNDGLRAFKQGWGTVESELVYSSIGTQGAKAGDGRVAQALGAVIRHSPPWMCRLVGETLYRHAA